ncbi:MAG: GxxExxY protein [Gemmatimonadaceae bacterium]|nr:GxxExxY protein [Gemmatimonadaceae bacterium]
MTENELSRHIVDAALEVHRVLGGPGLLEHIYDEALATELTQRGFKVQRQVPVPVHYKGVVLTMPLRLDLLVNDLVIVESKAVSKLIPAFIALTISYLYFSNKRLALLINFGQSPLRQGIRRVVNRLADS